MTKTELPAVRTITALIVCAGMLMSILAAGCGGSGRSRLAAPKNPGTMEDLVGTTWTDPATSIKYTFINEEEVEMFSPVVSEPSYGEFLINDGIVEISAGFRTLIGTWDGTRLVIDGTEYLRE
jgi:hypothetical protein